jgi:hypothetical protein
MVEGKSWWNFKDASGMEILNRGTEPTFCNGYRTEVIDITLGSLGLLDYIQNWEVSLEPSLSDHRHILFTLRGSLVARLSRNPRGIKWDSYREELQDLLCRGPMEYIRDDAGLGLALQWLQHAQITAYDNNCPMRQVKPARNFLRWTARLEALRRRVTRLLNRAAVIKLRVAGSSIERPSESIEERCGGHPKNHGGPSAPT